MIVSLLIYLKLLLEAPVVSVHQGPTVELEFLSNVRFRESSDSVKYVKWYISIYKDFFDTQPHL